MAVVGVSCVGEELNNQKSLTLSDDIDSIDANRDTTGTFNQISFVDVTDFFRRHKEVELVEVIPIDSVGRITLIKKMHDSGLWPDAESSSYSTIRFSDGKKCNISFHLIEFKSLSSAEESFRKMKELVDSDSYFEKPFNLFYIDGNKIYLFSDMIFSETDFGYEVLINMVQSFCPEEAVYNSPDPGFKQVIQNCR
ncbi:hypothetical protein KFE98_09495 [bacterium SCSIO 12741]|nr:hypothetical protein KFE98_09495 [bacterium SCSIO 12741]